MKLRPCLLLLLALPAAAHVISMSSGEVRLENDRAHYELQMPLYEIAHVEAPERALLNHIRFASGGTPARRLSGSCHPDPAQGLYLCVAEYQFPEPVERLDVECTFHTVTVPNHVHLLRAQRGERRDQAIFDFSFPKAEIRFDPPTAWETALTQTAAGWWRAWGGLAQVLFLASLALAARSRRELAALVGMFLAGQTAVAWLVPFTSWQPAPRFVEAAAALTIAYLAVEILLLPQAGSRWVVAGVLGGFHGLYFDLFLRTSGYHAGFVLAGAALGDLLLVVFFALLFRRIGKIAAALRPVQVSASLLLVIGMVWFFMRLRG
jgi:HupE / UreJ protein